MKNSKVKHKCPFKNDKFCFHKGNTINSHRRVCGYKNTENCPMFLEWLENREYYELNDKVAPWYLITRLNTISQPITTTIPKLNYYMLNKHHDAMFYTCHLFNVQMKTNVYLCLCLMGKFGEVVTKQLITKYINVNTNGVCKIYGI